MHPTPFQTVAIILAVAAGTQITRWLPFWLFPEKKDPPAVVLYLGREHKQTVMVKSKYTTKIRRQRHGGTVVHYTVVCKCGVFNRKFTCSHRVYEHMREGQSYLAKTKMGEILSLHNQ